MTSTFEVESSGNIFADLGFDPGEAETLTAKTALILAMKGVMTDRALTQKQAAKVCGTDQPTLSKVRHGRMENVTLDRLAHWLTALGQDVQIRSGRRRRPVTHGYTSRRHEGANRVDTQRREPGARPH